MKKNREELGRIHKEQCRELKKMRAKMAEDLGIELHQRECTYEGYCSGTCPKCREEEMKLNAAIFKRQLLEVNARGKILAAGLTAAAAVSLSGCGITESQIEGGMSEPIETTELPGISEDGTEKEMIETEEENTVTNGLLPLENGTEEEYVLEGDVVYIDTEAEEMGE